MKQKVTVVGAGNVGATAAQRIVEKELADVALIDIVEGVPQGKALDIMESAPVEKFDARMAGSNGYEISAGSDVVVITAGVPRKPGMSRDDLVATNEGIVADVVRKVLPGSPDAILIVVSNPARRDVRGGAPGLEAAARARLRHGRRPRLGAHALVHRRGARRLGREHARVRARRPRRHDGAAAALLDGRRHPAAGAAAQGEDRRDRPAHPRRRRRDRQPPEDLGLVRARLGRRRDGGCRAAGQEEDPALRRVPPGRVRHARRLPRRSGQARRAAAWRRSSRSR